jgi:ATP-dependent DNA helicase HFM1/MER3
MANTGTCDLFSSITSLLHISRCNHPCKDKSTCRHLWYALLRPYHLTDLSRTPKRSCRTGLDKPPTTSRQRGVGPQAGMDMSVKKKTRRVMPDDSASGSRSPYLVKASAQRLNASLQQLESLHKSSGTDSHLRIPSGKRIKLLHDTAGDNAQLARITTKKRPKFDMDFSVLADDDAKTVSACFFDATDSDEFPEPHELVRASVRSAGHAGGSLGFLSSEHSDSETDALIHEARLSGNRTAETDIVKTQDVSTLQPIQPALTRKGSTHGDPIEAKATPASPLLRPQVRIHWRKFLLWLIMTRREN